MDRSHGGRDHHLNQLGHLNKLSHKISKPLVPKPPVDQTPFLCRPQQPLPAHSLLPRPLPQPPPLPPQPPVYNINKNDFRDVVQKLTGSPAHEKFSSPPLIHPPRPSSSRLQRIRPPPLQPLNNLPCPYHLIPNNTSGNSLFQGSLAPSSPLLPLPSIRVMADSPVSAYMRYLHGSISSVDFNNSFSGLSPLPLPLTLHHQPQQQQQHQHQQQVLQPQQGVMASTSLDVFNSPPPFLFPASPLPFGCFNSPRSPYPLLSPTALLSSAFPPSPTLPFPSPVSRTR